MTPETAQNLADRAQARMERKLGKVPDMVLDADARQSADLEDVVDDPVAQPPDYAQEVIKLKQDLAALQGRVAPAQRDLETYRQLTVELQQRNEQLEQQLKQKPQELKLEDVLTPEEIDELDPMVLGAMAKIASAQRQNVDVNSAVNHVLAQRQEEELRAYREQALLSRELSDIVELKADPRFVEWANQDDNDVESVVTMLLGAGTKSAIDKYARILKRRVDSYRESIGAPRASKPASDATTALAAGMRRGQTSVSATEMQTRLAQARRLMRSRSAADRAKATQILNSLGG